MHKYIQYNHFNLEVHLSYLGKIMQKLTFISANHLLYTQSFTNLTLTLMHLQITCRMF